MSTGSSQPAKTPLLLLLLLCLFIGGSVVVLYWLSKEKQKVEPPAFKPGAEQEAPVKISSVVYAYKEGVTTQVRRFKVTGTATEEVFSFREAREADPDSGNFYAQLLPAVAGSPDGKTLAYMEENNLRTYALDSGMKTDLVTKTGSIFVADLDAAKLMWTPPIAGNDHFGLHAPEWSLDGKYIGFLVEHYEGSSAQGINVANKTLLNLQNNFHYVDETPLGQTFTIETANKELAEHGLLGEYLITPWESVRSPLFSRDGQLLYGILCPLNLPDSGFHTYSTSGLWQAAVETLQNQRDCGEAEDRPLIAINTTDGSYKPVSFGQFDSSFALQNGLFYIPLTQNGGYKVAVIKEDGTAKSAIDTLSIAEVHTDDVQRVVVRNLAKPVAEVYCKKGNDRTVVLVDLLGQQKLTALVLAEKSTFAVLVAE